MQIHRDEERVYDGHGSSRVWMNFFCLHKPGLIMRIAIALAVDKSRFLTPLEYLLGRVIVHFKCTLNINLVVCVN